MRSEQFDDIYFSTEDGLAESRHTYLAGNNLPTAWQNTDTFHILELGFGSGLNFLATLQLWRRTAKPSQKLHYTAIELHPLPWQSIEQGLQHWRSDLSAELDMLQQVYQAKPQSRQIMYLENSVTLDLLCMEANEGLAKIVQPTDAIYLDGFAPAKNPAMWSLHVFKQLARLSLTSSTFATFTVARSVRDNALAAGFIIKKARGYGRKAEMLTGCFTGL